MCISILHEPGEDKFGYEKPEERWLPIHTVETIMISVISMLADPNGDSPANVDAAVSLVIFDDNWLMFYNSSHHENKMYPFYFLDIINITGIIMQFITAYYSRGKN